MHFEFGDFRVDSARRSLLLGERELPLQPKAFDLLVYLIEHRDRVVGKSELLDTLWPDVVVSDGSLKRAANLVRAALREGNAEDLIRNYPRQGYRFCSDRVVEKSAGPRPLPPRSESAASELEAAGRAAHFAGHPEEAMETLQRAVAEYTAEGNPLAAARCAFHLAHLHYDLMQLTVGRGWLARGRSLLPEDETTHSHGHAAWLASRYASAEGDIDAALAHADEAHAIGKALGDPNLEALGLMYRGIALVALGEARRGCAEHDQAAVAVLGSKVDPWVGGLVYCGMIYTCRNRADWQRAQEWTHRFQALCDTAGDAALPGTCRLHRAEFLQVTGALSDAQREVENIYEDVRKRVPYAVGDWHRTAGDIHLARGDLEAASREYGLAYEYGWDPQPGLALLHVARGNPQAGLKALKRSLTSNQWGERQRRAVLLAHLVRIAVAAGAVTDAQAAMDELEQNPELWQTPALEAAVAEARGELLFCDGERDTSVGNLRRAAERYRAAQSAPNAARLHLRVAELLVDDDPEGAKLELQVGRALVEQLDVPPLHQRLAQVAALLVE